LKPEVVAYELNKYVTDDAVISTDSGTITTWIARHLDIRGNQQFSCSGNLATMACGLPYAIAAAVAYPGRQSVAFVGDGGLTMLMGELATCVKYGLDVKVVVIKNNVLGQIKWEQMVFLGNPEFGCELQPIDFAGVARACGVQAFFIDDPEKCGAEDFASAGVVYFEEPVSSDDLEGLRSIRDRAPHGMKIAAGEYGYDLFYFRRMLEAGATDVQQADASARRSCGGSLCTARPRSICMERLPLAHSGTRSGSTITSASSICCSMARLFPRTASCAPISAAPVSASNSSIKTHGNTP
jgi:hypothetical protein